MTDCITECLISIFWNSITTAKAVQGVRVPIRALCNIYAHNYYDNEYNKNC